MTTKFYTILIVFLLGTWSVAAQQVPHLFNYQGIARDANSNPLSKQSLGLKISVLAAEGVSEAEYEEVQTVTTNEYGLYTLQIGGGTATKGEMKMVTWETGNKYIRVAIDPKGGTNYTDLGTTKLLSVPYAIYADRAGSAKNGGGSDRAGAVSTSAAGTGTVNFLTKFTGANTIYNSQVFDNGTNIGIGTTSPNAKLQLTNNTTSATELRINHTNTTGGASRLSFKNDSESGFTATSNFALLNKYAEGITGNVVSGYPISNLFGFNNSKGNILISTKGSIGFGFYDITANPQVKLRMHIDSAEGNVGINTLNPKAKLHVTSNKDTVGYFTSNSANLVSGVLRAEYIGVGSTNDNVAIYGKSISNNYNNVGIGLLGEAGYIGAQGIGKTKSTLAVYGMLGEGIGAGDVFGIAGFASNDSTVNNGIKVGVFGSALGGTDNFAGYFEGNAVVTEDMNVVGNISKGAGTFKIDHPLDPANKFLYHSFVESADMMNIYNGNITTDANGKATVTLPDYFEALNKDYRYQLTAVGQPSQLWISKKVNGNAFEISSSLPNTEVSWQVTGVRKDPYANENRVEVEVEKSEKEKGKYLHPKAYGKSSEYSITPVLPSVKKRVNQ